MRDIGFRAMGTDVHIIVAGSSSGDALLEYARSRINGLERLWSRFLDDSEISRLNACAGRFVEVSAETFALVRLAVEGSRMTRGLFDPTVLHALVAAGYDRSFESMSGMRGVARPGSGCEGIAFDVAAHAIALPEGVGFDPGGIGKGFAADLVAGELRERGATGACVNVGGDLRTTGSLPGEGRWTAAVEDPHGGSHVAVLEIGETGVATTSSARRAWTTDGVRLHHVIDPATGAPSEGGVLAVTVLAPHAWQAEVIAKAAYVSGGDGAARTMRRCGASGLVILADGSTIDVDLGDA